MRTHLNIIPLNSPWNHYAPLPPSPPAPPTVVLSKVRNPVSIKYQSIDHDETEVRGTEVGGKARGKGGGRRMKRTRRLQVEHLT